MLKRIFFEGTEYMKKKYFGNSIQPSCQYCQFGSKSKEGNKILCEKQGLVDPSFSCKKFLYAPIKRIPVKQLAIVGDDDDII